MDLRKPRQYLKHASAIQAIFLNEAGKTKNLLTADFHGFTRIRFLEFKRMGASGHLFSPGSFGKRTCWQDGIAFAHCAFSKRTWREKVQRGALAHALAGKHILIRVDP
mgnify:CR=1 FL=1